MEELKVCSRYNIMPSSGNNNTVLLSVILGLGLLVLFLIIFLTTSSSNILSSRRSASSLGYSAIPRLRESVKALELGVYSGLFEKRM